MDEEKLKGRAEPKHRVLVVEDDSLVLHSLAIVLEDEFDVRMAQTGEQAWELLQHEPFSVVISDIMMRGMNGFDLLKLIRANFPDLPVIMLSGYVSDQRHERIMKAGAFAYLVKPVDDRLLVRTIREALASVKKNVRT